MKTSLVQRGRTLGMSRALLRLSSRVEPAVT
jgi:hypothetical protein